MSIMDITPIFVVFILIGLGFIIFGVSLIKKRNIGNLEINKKK